MSSKNSASILTTAMQNAEETTPDVEAPETESNDVFVIRIPKYVIKKAAIGALIGGIVGYAASRLLSASDEDAETESDTQD